MLEIFITVVAAVIVGAILVKFWRPIFAFVFTFVFLVISLVIYIPMYIMSLLGKLIITCVSDETLEEKITQTYDEMLNVAYTPKDVARGRKNIKWFETILKYRKEKRFEKQVEKMLEEAKWVL